ncbi:MAG: agmatinase, partial [Methanomassiliicoccaceae archaeon]|nr:agmatinase [Methanomassiliicoccaceae archaeon]
MPYGITYAGAESDYDSADAFILGIPYDRTSSFRAGAREAPFQIRRASYNFEEILFEHGLDLPQLNIFDQGNCEDPFLPEDMMDEVKFFMAPAVKDGKFTVAIGGEHSVNIPIIQCFEKNDIALITIDAHLDSRDEYLGTPYSHACVTRRAAEHLGIDNVFSLGVRSISREELERDDVIPHITSFEIKEKGIEWAVKKALDHVRSEWVYLSLDIDGIDPAYAPGTGTPEPFGLEPMDVKKAIGLIGNRLAGFDVTEVCPPADPSGITSVLAARLINEALVVRSKYLI